jgi:oxygen-independent coproporphyrinogen-3 oxidase
LAGIYIHIPFCKQACHYCNFHFSTSFRRKNELVAALLSEIDLRKGYLLDAPVETIYFGGGTPSLLDTADLAVQMDKLFTAYNVTPEAEITIETNPDDIIDSKLKDWKRIGFNRVSIGVQSFFEEDLRWMNRAHSAEQAIGSLELAKRHFDNISIDLIYGLQSFTNEKWKQNVDRAISHNVPHLSCYALTVEPKTRLHKMITSRQIDNVDADKQSEQFLLLMQWMQKAGYEHYEISNFAKAGFRSRHNSSYWHGQKYLGLGPSSHSYNGSERQWNVSNNSIYINSINKGVIPHEKEILTPVQKLNEYIMTSLRTIEGLNLSHLPQTVGNELRVECEKYFKRGLMVEEQNHLKLTPEGKLLADGIAADLFFIKKNIKEITP